MQNHLNRVALHLRWLVTEKFQNNETVKGRCIPNKNECKTQKISVKVANKFKLLHAGCPITHDFSSIFHADSVI